MLFISLIIFAYEGFHSAKIEVGARECAMGGTGVSYSESPSGIYWNPGLVAMYVSTNQIQLFNYFYFANTVKQGVLYVRRLSSRINTGLSLIHFTGGQIELRDETVTEVPVGYYSFHDITAGITMAGRLSPQASAGITFKYYFEKLWKYETKGIGVDIGVAFQVFEKLYAGFSIIDFGGSLMLGNDLFNLPAVGKIGVFLPMDFDGLQINTAVSLDYRFYSPGVFLKDRLNSASIKIGTGVEVTYKILSFRAGVKFSDNIYCSSGIGIKGDWIAVDYSFSQYRYIPQGVHRIDIIIF